MGTPQSKLDFESALERLRENSPSNEDLKRKYEAKHRKITISDVALEAGRSRRLIYKYPELLEQINSANLKRRLGPNRTHQMIANLRRENENFRAQLAMALTEQAALVSLVDELERKQIRSLKQTNKSK